MSSYHSSFTYKDKNSFDEGLIIVSFEPDVGFMDSFLAMENVSDDYYDGTKRFDYNSKYSSQAEIQIALIKRDGTDMTISDFRSYARWLTGARVNSWLDMYVGSTVVYSFLGKFLNLEQYKYDSRTVGIRLTFSSVSPWAYSPEQHFDYAIKRSLFVDSNNILNKQANDSSMLGFDSGVLYVHSADTNSYFNVSDDGIAYIDKSVVIHTDNKTDDLYTYINLDINYTNGTGDSISIKNITLDEETIITGMSTNEVVTLSAKQFIVSNIPNKIFGDNFNFVWPRLAPGINQFVVDGATEGKIDFTYRYPMKIGDCVIDTDILGDSLDCGCPGTSSDCTVDEQELYSMLKSVLG